MDDLKKEDLEKKVTPSVTPEEQAALDAKAKEDAENQDPLKIELDKVQNNKPKYTKVEKLKFTKKRIEEQLKAELGDDYENDDEEPLDDDKRPLTVGEFKKMQVDKTVKTALTLADEIESPIERELVKHHLENTIKSSGDAQEDLKNARAIVNNLKNQKILEENGRRINPKEFNSGGTGPAKDAINDELLPDEIPFTRAPFNMSKADILKARKQ